MSKKIQIKTSKSLKPPVTGSFLRVDKPNVLIEAKKSLLLYRFVYSSRLSLSVVFLLIISFSCQSVERAFAAEELPQEIVVSETETQAFVIDIESESTTETNSVPEEQVLFEIISSNVENSTPEDVEVSDKVTEDVVDIFDLESVPNTESSSTENLIEINSEAEEPPLSLVDNHGENSDNDSASSTVQMMEEDNTLELATTTEEISEDFAATHETVSVTESDSEFSFKKDECTQLATGSFYCMQPDANRLEDALFSAPDADGDLEIFLTRAGLQVQVTSNNMDDAAPYFDKNSNSVVWQRLIDDRYQIISYDVDEEEESQITKTAENNMEPTRQGQYTVWQRWIDGGWNIILFDGKSEKQITKTSSHNVAPYIHGSLVVWNSRDQSGEKTIEMFDIESSTYVTVDDPDGLSVSNPRMVFVYDSLHPNGDIVTKGYDVMAKKFIDLDSLPVELPDELPSSDSTGETRALIQPKPTIKSDAEESIAGNNSSTLPIIPPDQGSSTTALTLDLSASSTEESISMTEKIEIEIPIVVITPEKVDIEPFLLDGVPL
jgi:hypothetical protein